MEALTPHAAGPALERIDPYPYRHRVADLLEGPPPTVDGAATLRDAAREMRRAGHSAVIVDPDARAGGPGILTERDLVHLLADEGAAAMDRRAAAAMSAPLVAVPAEALLFVALGRMTRLRLRHLAVTDPTGRVVGLLTARMLLRQRASRALAIGDAVTAAATPEALRAVHAALPGLAASLAAEGVAGPDIAAAISQVLCDVTARAVVLALAGRTPPAPFAFLVLGSGGRGESLLAADQDNAIVHGGGDGDDGWFAALGERVSALLDGAGIPLCKGGVMASRPAWRHSLDGWRRTLEGWVQRAEGENLLSVDIFYDFRCVYGDHGLADALRGDAMAAAARPMLPRMMALELQGRRAPLGLLGGFRTENGRLDLKRHGLFPIVAGARALALRHGVADTATDLRLRAAAARGLIGDEDLAGLLKARAVLMETMLDQQARDLAAGAAAGAAVDVARLSRPARTRLRRALRQAATMAPIVAAGLSL